MVKSVYIHIPFCYMICSYCDFCKMYYNDYVSDYLNALDDEISSNYKNEVIDTLYIGGGTPSCLSLGELEKLFEITKRFKLSCNYEFTIECNINDLTKEKIELFIKNKVNRISIGIQSFNSNLLNTLNRNHNYEDTLSKINLLKSMGLTNINIDLMYAIPGEDINVLSKDLDLFLSLDVPHISTYSLIIEPNTMLYIKNIKNIDEELDYEMYKLICTKLKSNNYIHYETSNFSKDKYQSKHNLTYWNNEFYYGFGLGASGYISNIRYTNTRNIKEYIKGNYKLDSEILTDLEKQENEMILGLRKLEGVNENLFYDKYHKKIDEVFNINKLLEDRMLIRNNNYIKINEDYIYLSNEILINFLL